MMAPLTSRRWVTASTAALVPVATMAGHGAGQMFSRFAESQVENLCSARRLVKWETCRNHVDLRPARHHLMRQARTACSRTFCSRAGEEHRLIGHHG